jgi:hypothetical protein
MPRAIDIQITKGKIESFSVDLSGDFPTVMAGVGLYTADDKKISSFSIGSASWNSERFEIPADMIQPILDISQDLERIVMIKCNSMMGRLANPEKEIKPEVVETPLGEQIDGGAEEVLGEPEDGQNPF